MTQLSIRGVIAPVATALALAAGVLGMRTNQPFFLWSCIGLTFVGLAFAKDASRLLSGDLSDSDA